MPTTKRYYDNIPMKWKVRRAKGSPSFRETLLGKYVVFENRKISAEAFPYGQKRIDLQFKDDKGKLIGVLCARRLGGVFEIYHREIFPEYKGLNLGRVGFRLMELVIKKIGSRGIVTNINRLSVLNTLLGLGWKVDKRDEINLKKILGLTIEAELPALREIRQILRNKDEENLSVEIHLRKSLANGQKAINQP